MGLAIAFAPEPPIAFVDPITSASRVIDVFGVVVAETGALAVQFIVAPAGAVHC